MQRLFGLINVPLISEPMNWAILFVIATIWLLAFHVIMQGFTAMQGGGKQTAIGAAPGQIAIPGAPGNFATGSTIAGGESPDTVAINLSQWGFDGTSDGTWTDGTEAKYAWDGYLGGI